MTSVYGHQAEYLDELFARLDDVLNDLAELSRVALPVEQLNALLLRETALITQAQGLQAKSMQVAEDTALSVRYGTRILTTHLVKHTNQPTQVLGSARSVADWLVGFPVLLDAMVAGVLSRSHVLELRKIDNGRTHHLLVRDQQFFVDGAREILWTDWMQLVAYWLNAADPDGDLTDPADPAYGMTVRTKANGDVAVTILMDPVTGEAFLTMHDAELSKIERADAERRNEDPNYTNRTLREKNLDALLRLMVRGWRREDGTYPDFLVNIVMSQTVAEDLLARTFGHEDPETGESPLDVDPFSVPINWDDLDGRCETIRGTPIHPKHALGLLLAGELRRTVLGADKAEINHGVGVRLFDKTQRNLLLVLQRGQCASFAALTYRVARPGAHNIAGVETRTHRHHQRTDDSWRREQSQTRHLARRWHLLGVRNQWAWRIIAV